MVRPTSLLTRSGRVLAPPRMREFILWEILIEYVALGGGAESGKQYRRCAINQTKFGKILARGEPNREPGDISLTRRPPGKTGLCHPFHSTQAFSALTKLRALLTTALPCLSYIKIKSVTLIASYRLLTTTSAYSPSERAWVMESKWAICNLPITIQKE